MKERGRRKRRRRRGGRKKKGEKRREQRARSTDLLGMFLFNSTCYCTVTHRFPSGVTPRQAAHVHDFLLLRNGHTFSPGSVAIPREKRGGKMRKKSIPLRNEFIRTGILNYLLSFSCV